MWGPQYYYFFFLFFSSLLHHQDYYLMRHAPPPGRAIHIADPTGEASKDLLLTGRGCYGSSPAASLDEREGPRSETTGLLSLTCQVFCPLSGALSIQNMCRDGRPQPPQIRLWGALRWHFLPTGGAPRLLDQCLNRALSRTSTTTRTSNGPTMATTPESATYCI